MPDSIVPVAAQIQAPNPTQGISTLSGILGLQQQRQALAGQAAEVQQTQQTARQRQALAKFFGNIDWSKYDSDDGTIDTNKIMMDQNLKAAAGDQYPQVLQVMAVMKNMQVQNKTAVAGLNDTLRGQLGSTVGALRNDPDVVADNQAGRDKVRQAITAWGASGGPDAQRIASMYSQISDRAPPGKLGRGLQALQNMTVAAGQQAEQQKQSNVMVQGPNGLQPFNVNPNAPGGVGPAMDSTGASPAPVARQGFSPPERAEPVLLPNGQLGLRDRATGVITISQANGQDVRVQPPPGTTFPGQSTPTPQPPGPGPQFNGQPGPRHPGPVASRPSPSQAPRVRTAMDDAPPPNAPAAVQQNFAQAAASARDHVAQTRAADEGYGVNVNLSNAIRRLSADTKTGPGSEMWQHFFGALGAPVGLSNVSNYQLLGAYLDRQAASLRSQMGLPSTNEGVQTSQAIQGNTQYQREAIQDKNDLTQALVEGVHQYRNGLDRVEAFTGNPSPTAVQRFRAAWANNFDPNVYKLENAQKRIKEDPEAVSKVLAELSPSEAASLRQKRLNLQALAKGQIPQ